MHHHPSLFKLLPLLTVTLLLQVTKHFQFASMVVTADTKTINTVTRYRFTYDRTQNDNSAGTAYLTVPIIASDTVTVTFPNTYTLSSITCSISINGGTPYTPSSCTVSGLRVIVGGVVTSNTVVANVVLWVNGIVNPTPAITTDYFYGTIGSDSSGPGSFQSTLILQPATFLSCYITFSPNIVNSTSDMLLTVIPRNTIGSSGSIQVQLPVSRRWTNDISTTNLIPITTSMSCSNRSSNIKSTFQCISDSSSIVTASNPFIGDTSSSFSFSINGLLSPPTQQPSDPIVVTSYIAGSKIDTCTTYVTNLLPKSIVSIWATSSTDTPLQVNKQYILRFYFTLPDTLALTDTLVVGFPSGTTFALNTGNINSNFSVVAGSSTYDATNLNLNLVLSNQNRSLAPGSVLFLNVGTYTAPPSVQTTGAFTLTFNRNGFRKIQGTTTLTATPSTLSGTSAVTTPTVNSITSYSFTLTTLDPLSSSGRIKIILPSSLQISTTSTSCATVTSALTNSNLALTPVCIFNTVENSISLTSINASGVVIPAQTFTVVINGIKNQAYAGATDGFRVFTYFRNSQVSLVASGVVSGVTTISAELDTSKVSVTSSSYNVNDQSVTYSLSCTIVHPIPAGGYFLFLIPSNLMLTPSSVSGQCSININSTSYIQTSCIGSTSTSGYIINFTNPFQADMTVSSTFIARVASIFTNPYSTRPTNSFGLITYHANGNVIAGINGSLGVQMDTPDAVTVGVSRNSQKNYQVATYTFTLKQKSIFQPLSYITIGFPTTITLPATSVCTMLSPSSTTLTCLYTGSTLRISLPNSSIASNTAITLTVTNLRNPPSFTPTGPFTIRTVTPQQSFTYSYTITNPSLTTSIATSFQSLTYSFTPSTYGTTTSLTINFDPSDSGTVPTSLRFTLANSFTIQALSCNSFVNFVGVCNSVSSNTIDVTGTFSGAGMSFGVNGFVAPLGPVTDYSVLVSLDAGGYRLDQSTNNIIFGITCTMPCMTCQPTDPTLCTGCYSNTLITSFIYYDSALNNCYQDCPQGKYQSSPTPTSNLCLACNPNCLACNLSPTFCTKCSSTSTFKYLFINTTDSTQKCLTVCPSTYYAQSSVSPVTCKLCVSPCKQCTSAVVCASCVTGFYYYLGQCLSSCPSSITVANSGSNNCDYCDVNCLTCAGTVTTCTSCNQSLLLYLNVCRTSCPTPLVPKNGTCGSCDTTCKTCVDTPFKCTSCDTTSTIPYLFNNLCLSDCPQTYYKNIGAGVCSLCSSVPNLRCVNCSSSSTCKSCDLGYVLYNSSCLDYVPLGFVNISGVAVACTGDCRSCSVTKQNCTSCISLNYYNYQCLTNCPAGFVAISKICTACLSPCRTCQTTVDTCTSCLVMAPNVFLTNSQCLQTCPNSMYPASSNYTCLPCQSPCEYCTSATVCTTCLTGFFLFNNSCPTVCPSGYTGINRVCMVCLGNCATCTGTVNTCLTCKPDTYLMDLNSSCVTSCGTGLFIDYLDRKCVTCSPPCKTCTNTSDTCLSCTTGILFNNQCLNQCPQKYYVQSNQCQLCPTNCSSCLSLVNCTACAQDFVLYTGFCITQCPGTHSVVINSVCTKCSTTNCHKCSSADFCTECQSDFSLYNGACLGTCPSGFETNGTHCLDTNVQVLTQSAAFPVPFSIATVVIGIACLMSKMQFQHTFMAGAMYSLISIVETASLGYFLYLYFIQFFATTQLPFFVAAAALAYLYLLNLLAIIVQNITLCYDKHYSTWYKSKPHKISSIITNILSTLISHKFRNILFSKLFTFDIFTAQLQSNNKFKVFNVFSFLSLLHSGAAIFASSVAIQSVQAYSQIFYACIDIFVTTGINCVLAFFNVMKPTDFFYERTQDGFELKKKITGDDDYYHSKIEPEGKAIQDEEGFATNIYRVQAGTGFTTNQLLKIRGSNSDIDDKDYSFGSLMEKNVQQVSIQAVEQLPQKQVYDNNQNFSIAFGNSPGRSGLLPIAPKHSNAEISIQSSPMLARSTQQRVYNSQSAKQQDPKRTIFYKQPANPYSTLKTQNQPSSKISKPGEKDRKKIFDSSSEQQNSEISKNILYKSKPTKIVQQQPSVQQTELKDAAVGKYTPIQFVEGETKLNKRKVDEGVQRADFGYHVENEEFRQKKPTKNVIFQEEEEDYHDVNKGKNKVNAGLQESKKDQIVLPKEDIKEYEKQLQMKIKAKNEELQKMKKKIQDKQKFTQSIKNVQVSNIPAGKLYKKASQNQRNDSSPEFQSSKTKIKSPQKIVEQIDVIDSSGQKRVINVQFNDRVSKQSQQNDYLQGVQDHPKQLIYEESDNEQPQQNQFVQIISKGKQSKQLSNNTILQPERVQLGPKQSQGEFMSGNDTSTRFQSSALNQEDTRRGKDGRMLNVDEIDKSIDQQSQGINQQPKQSKLLKDMHTDFSDARSEPRVKLNVDNKKYSKNLNRYEPKSQQIIKEDQKDQHRKRSPIKGQQQVKKNPNIGKSNPLKIVNRFQFEKQDRNISESGQDQIKFNRTYRNRLNAPFETDKQQTEFKTSGTHSPRKMMVARAHHTIQPKSDFNEYDDQPRRNSPSKNSVILNMEYKQSPLKSEKFDMEFGPPDRQDEPDIEYNESKGRPGTVDVEREDSDSLRRYYEETGARKSRQKSSKKRASQAQIQAEKIYLQRQDLPRKWK